MMPGASILCIMWHLLISINVVQCLIVAMHIFQHLSIINNYWCLITDIWPVPPATHSYCEFIYRWFSGRVLQNKSISEINFGGKIERFHKNIL